MTAQAGLAGVEDRLRDVQSITDAALSRLDDHGLLTELLEIRASGDLPGRPRMRSPLRRRVRRRLRLVIPARLWRRLRRQESHVALMPASTQAPAQVLVSPHKATEEGDSA